MTEKSKHLENSDSTVIFLYGLPGSGKTCFLASLLRYLYKYDYDLILNTQQNPKGSQYFMYLLETIDEMKIPEITGLAENNEIDICITLNGQERYYTFVDVSGEHLSFKDESNNLDLQTKEKVDTYLANPNISVILLSFFDPANPEFSLNSQDKNHFILWNYIRNKPSFFYSIAGIITKVDKLQSDPNYEDLDFKQIARSLVDSHLSNTYNFIKRFKGINCSIIPYSIGIVSDDNESLISIDESGAKKILEWLESIFVKKKSNSFKIFITFIIVIFIILHILLYEFSLIITGSAIGVGILTSLLYDYYRKK